MQVYRCSDGHLFVASTPRLLLKSLNVHVMSNVIGPIYCRCPVDRKFRVARPVAPLELSAEEISSAEAHPFR